MKRLYLIVSVVVLVGLSTTLAMAGSTGGGFKKPPVVEESVNASSDSWLNTVLKKLGFDSN